MFSVFPNPYSSNGPLVSHFFTLGSAMYILVLGGIQIAGKCPQFCVNFQHFLMQFIYDFSKDGAKRRRRREGRVRWRGWVSPQKKKHFCSLGDKYGCISTLVSRQKTWTVTRSLATRILRFNRETKFTQTVQKLSKQFTVRPRGRGDRTIAPWIRHCYQA